MSAGQNPFGHRSVRCKKHGVAFNPELHSGCSVCRRGSGDAAPDRSETSVGTPFMIAVSVTLMVVTVLIMVTGERAYQREEAAAALAIEPQPSDDDQLLDPTPHRAAIAAIESVLYQRRPTESADEERLRNAWLDLETALKADAGSERASTRLYTLSQRVLGSGYALDFESVRSDWEAYRDSSFITVGWFQKSTEQLTEIQTIELVDTPEMIADQLETILIDLELMMEDGETEALQMAGYGQAPTSRIAAEEDAGDPVRTWSRTWRDRLDELLADRPAPPDLEQQPVLHEANGFLRDAIQQLQLVPVDAERGTQHEVEQRFTRARAAISSAREQLAQGIAREDLEEGATA